MEYSLESESKIAKNRNDVYIYPIRFFLTHDTYLSE